MMLFLMPDYPSDSLSSRESPKDKHKFCNALRMFIGFNPKGSSDSEGAKSPTSPLDIKKKSRAGITHRCENSLVSQFSSPKQQSKKKPIGSPYGFAHPTTQTGMEHSESYTCVTSHGLKWSTKHIYTHCGIQRETVQHPVQKQHEHGLWNIASAPRSYSNVPVFHVDYFLSSCYLCKRKLNQKKDIYMYRGDKAFCTVECRYQQILMDEQMETCPVSPPYSRGATSDGRRFFIINTAAAS